MPIYRKGDDLFPLRERAKEENKIRNRKDASDSFTAAYHNLPMKGAVSGDDLARGKRAREADDMAADTARKMTEKYGRNW
jgi:hypothetical protein